MMLIADTSYSSLVSPDHCYKSLEPYSTRSVITRPTLIRVSTDASDQADRHGQIEGSVQRSAGSTTSTRRSNTCEQQHRGL